MRPRPKIVNATITTFLPKMTTSKARIERFVAMYQSRLVTS